MRIRVLVSGGPGIGLGHVMRSAVLAQEAERAGHAVTVVLRGDASAQQTLAAELPGARIEPWSDPARAVGTEGAMLVDAPGPIEAELSAARRSGVRTVVLDRLDHLDDADATVLPVLHGPPIEHPRLFQGAEFLTVAPIVRAARGHPYLGNRSAVVVTAGGADPLGLTEPLTRALLDALRGADGPPVHAVLGPAFADPDALADRLGAVGAHVHRAMPRAQLVALLAGARYALTGFGTTVYDLAVLGTPVVYWTHRSCDLDAARRLEARGLGACGGDGTALAREPLAATLAATVLRRNWCARASTRARALVGAAEGSHAILRVLAGDSAERAA